MIELTAAQIAQFHDDGFLILERLIDPADAARVADRFDSLFRGHFETGLQPDEWNWQPGRDAPDRTRQICNGWKADQTIARLVLSATVGRLCAQLAGWPGARLAQDNVIWKPPGAKPLGFHQDNSYSNWFVPSNYLTCWIALDTTSAAGGTIEYVRGSHRWGRFPPIRQFHAPDNYREALAEAAARCGQQPQIVPVEVPAGGCAFHAGDTWHGSDRNHSDRPRRSAVSHCIALDTRFHATETSPVYSRYRRANDLAMDESFFPVLWTRGGYRSPFLADSGDATGA